MLHGWHFLKIPIWRPPLKRKPATTAILLLLLTTTLLVTAFTYSSWIHTVSTLNFSTTTKKSCVDHIFPYWLVELLLFSVFISVQIFYREFNQQDYNNNIREAENSHSEN